MGIKEIRLDNLNALIKQVGTQVAFAEEAGLSVAHVSHMVTGRRGVGESVARRIEQEMGLANGWMDVAHQVSEDMGTYRAALHGKAEIDWNKFALILEAVERALTDAKINVDTRGLLELADIFYELDADAAPKMAAVIKLHERIKMGRSAVG